ncbi:MAG: FHA domain-containing protein [Coriobacteriia bacterium]|nr:FHA domain-containing protein [Coriobacteriia bacterium]
MSVKCPICCNEFDDNTDVCPACGFKFSGKTESFAPIKTNTEEHTPSSGNHPSLRVIKGPQGEIVLPLAKESMTIGRSPNSDIFLNDRTVSREHAVVARNGDVYQIADKNSFNGLWINNKNITVSDLHPGDIIQIGAFFLRFEN